MVYFPHCFYSVFEQKIYMYIYEPCTFMNPSRIASKSHEGSSIHLKLNLVATQGKLKIFANNALTFFQNFKIVLRSQFKVLRIHNFLHK